MAGALRILIVEGDPLARAGLEYLLPREGFTARATATLEDARKNLGGIDVVLLELNLPDGNGTDLLNEIRAAALPIRVAIMTGTPQAAAKPDAAASDAYFEKPITRAKLDALLAWLRALSSNSTAP